MATARALLLHPRAQELDFMQGAYHAPFIGLVCCDPKRNYPALRLLACKVVAALERKAPGSADVENVSCSN
jgi:hypothetical protein